LFINISNPKGRKQLLYPGEEDFQFELLPSVDEAVSHLGWMIFLKNLVILSEETPEDVNALVHYSFLSGLTGPNRLERVWLSWFCDSYGNYNSAESFMTGHSVKTLQLGRWANPNFELDADKFRHLDHIAGIPFRRLDQFSKLKDFRGIFSNDDEVG